MDTIDDRQPKHSLEERIRRYRNKIELQRRMIHRQEKVIEEIRRQYLTLYREQFRDISRLLSERNFSLTRTHAPEVLSERVDRMLAERLSGGAKGLGEIPDSLNAHFAHVLAHLAEDFPDLSPVDYRLFCYLSVGFPSEQIWELLGMKNKNVLYLRKNRLLLRIRFHPSPWREEYLRLLSH